MRKLLNPEGNDVQRDSASDGEQNDRLEVSILDNQISGDPVVGEERAHSSNRNIHPPVESPKLATNNDASTKDRPSRITAGQKVPSENTPYYGPTSAHFDVDDSTVPPENEQLAPAKSTWRGMLVASAAIERQKEHLNQDSNKLDCDGWDPELVMHLLAIHWNRQHHNLSLIYRPLFMRDMAQRGPYFSKLLLNAILFAASKFSPRKDIRRVPDEPSTAGWQYRQRVRVLLGEALDQAAIPTIQALITVASSLFAIGEARSTSWLYSGVAFRMLVDLGLHRDSEDLVKRGKISIEELECRRRVFWGAFIFDKLHSMYLGRSATLQESDVAVPIEFFDDLEELDPWMPIEPGNRIDADYTMPKHGNTTTYSLTAYIAHCKLSVLLARILVLAYTNATITQQPIDRPQADIYLAQLDSVDRSLFDWMVSLPQCIRYEPWLHSAAGTGPVIPAPSTLSVTLMHHLIVILLHRPFLTQGHLYDARVAEHSLRTCTITAVKLACIIQHYSVAFTIRRAPYFVAYCAYVACTILIRVAHRVTIIGADADDFQHWLHILIEILRRSERTNAGVKRANFVLLSLLKRNRLDPDTFKPLPRIEDDFAAPPTNLNLTFSPANLAAILDSFATSKARTRAPQSNETPALAQSLGGNLGSLADLGQHNNVLSNDQAEPFTNPDLFQDNIFGFHSSVDPFAMWPTSMETDLIMFQ